MIRSGLLNNTDKMVEIITKACEDKKGIDIKVLDIRGMTSIADSFVIVSGNTSTQVNAISDEIEDKMEEAGFDKVNKEGHQTARWILMDYGDVLVHVFHKEDREFYDLERLWSKESIKED